MQCLDVASPELQADGGAYPSRSELLFYGPSKTLDKTPKESK